ncbi:MAG: MFS transporter [Chloroflexales bacterium]|nr:MFS transporter [Chloroflexales bacterium]
MEYSESARRRGLFALLAATFLMWGGFFMVVPLIAIHYVDGLGWAAAAIGLVLAVRQTTQQGLAMFGGVLADRIGVKAPLCAGMLVRALGFAAMAWANNLALLLLAVILAALGGALFEAPRSAAIAALTTQQNRARFYSLTGVVGGLGMTVGPLLGALLIKLNFALVCYAAAAAFVGCFLVTLALLPNVRSASAGQPLYRGLGLALHDRQFMLFTALLMGFWFMWTQLTLAIPLVAKQLSGTSDGVGIVYALNSGMTIVLQYPLLRLAERWLRPLSILCIGVALMAVGLGAVALAGTMPGLLACVALFSVGALLASPTQQTVAAELADPTALGSYFGVGMLALAIGGGTGNLAGGWLYETGLRIGWPPLLWAVCVAVGAVACAGLARMAYARRHQTTPTELRAAEAVKR